MSDRHRRAAVGVTAAMLAACASPAPARDARAERAASAGAEDRPATTSGTAALPPATTVAATETSAEMAPVLPAAPAAPPAGRVWVAFEVEPRGDDDEGFARLGVFAIVVGPDGAVQRTELGPMRENCSDAEAYAERLPPGALLPFLCGGVTGLFLHTIVPEAGALIVQRADIYDDGGTGSFEVLLRITLAPGVIAIPRPE